MARARVILVMIRSQQAGGEVSSVAFGAILDHLRTTATFCPALRTPWEFQALDIKTNRSLEKVDCNKWSIKHIKNRTVTKSTTAPKATRLAQALYSTLTTPPYPTGQKLLMMPSIQFATASTALSRCLSTRLMASLTWILGIYHRPLGRPLSSFSTRGFLSSNTLESLRSPALLQSPPCPFALHEIDNPPNVAGYLKRFHADFALQALPPQSSLEADVKASMRLESSPSAPTKVWTDICTTLIANAHTFTIKRIKLQRRLAPLSPTAPTPVSENPSVKQSTTPYHPPPDPRIPEAPPASTELESRFVTEPIFNIDDVLVDAIERVLLESGNTTPLNSTSSRSSSQRRGRQPASSMTFSVSKPFASSAEAEAEAATAATSSESVSQKRRYQQPGQDSAQVILGALEEVAREVFADDSARTEKDEDQDERGEQDSTALEKESTLREGVRRWKAEVERGPSSPSSSSAFAAVSAPTAH